MSEEITWTGCYDVLITERAELFGEEGVYGAFVNIVAFANSEGHFRELAAKALDEEGYQVLDVEDVGRIDLSNSGWPEEELELILDTLSKSDPVAFGYFHSYPKESLDG